MRLLLNAIWIFKIQFNDDVLRLKLQIKQNWYDLEHEERGNDQSSWILFLISYERVNFFLRLKFIRWQMQILFLTICIHKNCAVYFRVNITVNAFS